MAKVEPDKRRLMGAVLSSSFTVSLAPLTVPQSIALECLKQIASENREATQEEITAGIGSQNECGSTATKIINGLVAKGYIEHVMGHPLQRGIWVKIIATGQTTREPNCTVPHWRYRKDSVPTPAIQSVRQRSKTLADMIEAKAKQLQTPLSEYLMHCVYVGHLAIEAEG